MAKNDFLKKKTEVVETIGSLKKFGGEEYEDVFEWMEKFDDFSGETGWTEFQKLVISKMLLTGTARKFVRAQTELNLVETISKEELCLG